MTTTRYPPTACPQCGSRRLTATVGGPGNWTVECPDCGHTEDSTD